MLGSAHAEVNALRGGLSCVFRTIGILVVCSSKGAYERAVYRQAHLIRYFRNVAALLSEACKRSKVKSFSTGLGARPATPNSSSRSRRRRTGRVGTKVCEGRAVMDSTWEMGRDGAERRREIGRDGVELRCMCSSTVERNCTARPLRYRRSGRPWQLSLQHMHRQAMAGQATLPDG